MPSSRCSSSSSSSCKKPYVPQNIPGTWTPLKNQAYFGPENTFPGAIAPILMTDGTIMVVNDNYPYTGEIWKLTPDVFGDYINGTWSQLASLPDGYAPLYFAAGVLADGRVIFEGGEYNGPEYDFAETNLGAIYDPILNTWTPVNPPPFFTYLDGTGNPISDSSSVILEDGTFMLANNNNYQSALLNLETMTWTETGTETKADVHTEAGWTLLPNGKVFTVDTHITLPYPVEGGNGSEVYDPKTGEWSSSGTTIAPLNNQFISEMGPAPLMNDGKVFAVGCNGNTSIYNSYTGEWKVGPVLPNVPSFRPSVTITAPGPAAGLYDCGQGAQAVSQGVFSISGLIVPTVPFNADTTVTNDLTGKIALIATDGYKTGSIGKGNRAAAAGAIGCLFYQSNPTDNTNINGSTLVPSVIIVYADGQKLLTNLAGLSGTIANGPAIVPLGCADACGTMLPNGNVLFGAGPSYPLFASGTQFFEFDGTKLIEQESVPNAPYFPCYQFMSLILPTGQVLQTDFSPDVEIYTAGDRSYNPDWAPKIKSYPKNVTTGKTYKIKGVRFNGMSQGNNYGDDYGGATNYPLVRITNCKTKHVVYCRTHEHSFMGVASNKKVHTFFDIPENIESGHSHLEVVVNGIPSKKKCITVISDHEHCNTPNVNMILKQNIIKSNSITSNPKFDRIKEASLSEYK